MSSFWASTLFFGQIGIARLALAGLLLVQPMYSCTSDQLEFVNRKAEILLCGMQKNREFYQFLSDGCVLRSGLQERNLRQVPLHVCLGTFAGLLVEFCGDFAIANRSAATPAHPQVFVRLVPDVDLPQFVVQINIKKEIDLTGRQFSRWACCRKKGRLENVPVLQPRSNNSYRFGDLKVPFDLVSPFIRNSSNQFNGVVNNLALGSPNTVRNIVSVPFHTVSSSAGKRKDEVIAKCGNFAFHSVAQWRSRNHDYQPRRSLHRSW